MTYFLETTVRKGGLFSYTSAVDSVAIEPYLLHALTLTGLETYTFRPHPQLIESASQGENEEILVRYMNCIDSNYINICWLTGSLQLG